MGWTRTHVKISLNLTEVKGQRRIRIMGVRNTSFHGDTSMYRFWQPNVKFKKKLWTDTKTFQKSSKFDFEVKGQRHIGITNVRQTSSYDNIPMCQIW